MQSSCACRGRISPPGSKPSSGRFDVRYRRADFALMCLGRGVRKPERKSGKPDLRRTGAGGGNTDVSSLSRPWNGSFLAGWLIRSEPCCLVNMKALMSVRQDDDPAISRRRCRKVAARKLAALAGTAVAGNNAMSQRDFRSNGFAKHHLELSGKSHNERPTMDLGTVRP
jgi:hypothetical protein